MYLRCMTHLEPKRWNAWLFLAEWWYNTTYHTAMHISPLEALYGMAHSQLALEHYSHSKVAAVEDHLRDRRRLDDLLKKNLQEAQDRMKLYADQNMSKRTFSVGDWVYLRLQPYRQTSMGLRGNTKLSAKYFGPRSKGQHQEDRRIIKKKNAVAVQWLIHWWGTTPAEAHVGRCRKNREGVP